MRPTSFHIGGIVYWTLLTRDPDTLVLKDADSDPTVVVKKGNTLTGDSVTVTKRAATTGIYDCSYNPAGEVEGDKYTLEETADVTGTTTATRQYDSSFTVVALAVERGTDGANTTAPDNAGIGDAVTQATTAATQSTAAAASAASADAKLTSGRLSRIDRFPDINAGSAGGVALVGSAMSLDSATLTALFEDTDVAGLVTSVTAALVAQIDASDDVPVQAIATLAAQLTLAAILADGSIMTLLADASESAGAAAAAQTAAESVDGKLTAPRLALIDGAAQKGSGAHTLTSLSEQIDAIDGGGPSSSVSADAY